MSCEPCGCDLEARHVCDMHIRYPHWGKKVDESTVETLKKAITEIDDRRLRRFDSGATRDLDHNKLDYEGFLSPLVLERYAAYMHKNRIQKGGSTRDSDNWQRGIPLAVYMKSMWRHFWEVWSIHRGANHEGYEQDFIEEALCGVLFNAMGYLFEVLRAKDKR